MKRNGVRVAQIVVGVLLFTALLLAGLGALLPRRWHVEQSIIINAPPASVHRFVSDLGYWSEWAQWNKAELDPQNRLGNPSAGVGGTLTWFGRGGKASGEVRITQSDPAHGVAFESRAPDGDASTAQIVYVPRPGVTEVIWRDEGRLPPVVGGLFLDLFQKRLGKHMTAGLERLKELVELGGRLDPRVVPDPEAASD